MHMRPLRVSLSGPDLQELLEDVEASQWFTSGPPKYLSVDDKPQPPIADWIGRWVPHCRRSVFADWEYNETFLAYMHDFVVKGSNSSMKFDTTEVVSWLAALPFEIAAFGPVHPSWGTRATFPGPGFGDLHEPLGWACAFRGDGHKRLVSRRWLEFGPWRLIRGDNDISFVEFHTLETDADAAYAQARPGHERMGISDEGGFIQSDYVYTYPIDGLYEPQEHRLKILVHGREVSQLEMLDACAARLYQALGPQRPLDSVAYVFADATVAQAHLRELWLRELECWTFVDGRETRLDVSYRPPPPTLGLSEGESM